MAVITGPQIKRVLMGLPRKDAAEALKRLFLPSGMYLTRSSPYADVYAIRHERCRVREVCVYYRIGIQDVHRVGVRY